MSYDVGSHNYTSNMARFFRDFGAYPPDWHGRPAADVVTEFIEARLSETERAAREASERSERWTWQGTWWLEGVEHEVVGDEEAFCHPHNAGHIALNDPAHVLAWVGALRTIVLLEKRYRTTVERRGDSWAHRATGQLRAIAAIWHEHPDFESEWA